MYGDGNQMQPEIKLSYFNLTGLAEPIRMLLVYMNWEFTDHRIPYDQWLDVKNDFPFGKVPVMVMNNQTYHQSRAIGRYLAKRAGLYGLDSPEDDMRIDMLVDTIDDMRQAVTGWYYEKDPEVRKNKFNPMLMDTVPYYLSKLNKMAKQNEGFLVKRKQLTWADIYFTAVFDYIQELLRTDLSARIKDLMEVPKHVLAIPKMRRYWETRPRSHLKY